MYFTLLETVAQPVGVEWGFGKLSPTLTKDVLADLESFYFVPDIIRTLQLRCS